jgi:hypothetical protein
MNGRDELRELWCSQPYTGATKGEELVKLVEKRMRHFDRAILVRNLLECVAAVVVAALFTLFAVRAHGLQRAGFIVIAASAVWIVYYLLRYGHGPANADPDQDLNAFKRALLERYDRQIRLLKSVKYWYLLPPYIGLLIESAGELLNDAKVGQLPWRDFLLPLFYTAFFAFGWWLNEVYAVARLRTERSRLLSLAGEPNDSKRVS